MTTIQPLGTLDLAGSKRHPATYLIKACPKCYGVLYWKKKGQTNIECENCGHKIYMLRFKGPIDYVRQYLRTVRPWGRHHLNLICWAVAQKIDYHFRLRKLFLYLYMRGLSYL